MAGRKGEGRVLTVFMHKRKALEDLEHNISNHWVLKIPVPVNKKMGYWLVIG